MIKWGENGNKLLQIANGIRDKSKTPKIKKIRITKLGMK